MDGKAYGKGSTCPDIQPGKLRCYSMRFCPFAQRALLVLACKNIPHDVVNLDLTNKPEWIFTKNSEGKVPVIEQGDKYVSESLISSEYLDEIFPDNKLTSQDPYKKAKDRMLVEKFGKVTGHYFSSFKDLLKGDKEKWEELFKLFEFWEEELGSRGSKFFGGSRPGMLDLMIWPFFERFHAIALGCDHGTIPEDRLPIITSWIGSMLRDPGVKQYVHTPQNHRGFLESWAKGNADYDFGL